MTHSVVWQKSLSGFKVFGSQTPRSFKAKRRQVPDEIAASSAAIFIDVLRATTTLLAVGAAGCLGIYVNVKPQGAEKYPFVPPEHLDDRRPWVFGGELNGSPVVGVDADGNDVVGLLSNSPLEARVDDLSGKYLRFFSTNGADILQTVIAGQIPIMCAMAMSNIEATVDHVLSKDPDRIWLTCGAFYGSATLEDSVAAGLAIERLLHHGYVNESELDDEARSMLIQSRFFHAGGSLSSDHLVRVLAGGQVGLLLTSLNHSADIAAAVTGEGLETYILNRMRHTVLVVEPEHGPLIVPLYVGAE